MIDMLKASVFTVAAENVALYPRIMMRELSNGCDLKTFAENVAETKNELYRVNYLWECEQGIPVPFICFRNNGFDAETKHAIACYNYARHDLDNLIGVAKRLFGVMKVEKAIEAALEA